MSIWELIFWVATCSARIIGALGKRNGSAVLAEFIIICLSIRLWLLQNPDGGER